MPFTPTYYMTIACPTVKKTMTMVEEYFAHGARAFQFDFPSQAPTLESPLVQEMMAKALAQGAGYDIYMRAMKELKHRHPEAEIHLVVYPDVVKSIGLKVFSEYCKAVPLASIMLVASCPEQETMLRQEGIPMLTMAGSTLEPSGLERLAAVPPDGVVVVNYTRPLATGRGEISSFAQKLTYLREQGITAQIYAVEGIADAAMMREVRDAGARGALVGNVLMQLWDTPSELWKMLDEFQSLAMC